jgi:phenylalanyl-tRNA synthetase beta chain
MSADLAALRTTLREGVLRTLARNTRTWRGPVALFECARVYLDRGEGLPEEREMAVGALAGPRDEPHWSGETATFDFFDAKGAVESVLERLGLDAVCAAAPDGTFAGGRSAAVIVGGKRVGVVGEVAPDVLAAFDCEGGPVAMFELDVEALADLVEGRAQAHVQYRPFGRYPESVRDMSIVVGVDVEAGLVLAAARRARLVTGATIFDEYRGKGLPDDRKALGLRVVFQAPDRTLTSDEIDRAQAGILRALERECGAVLRT